MRQKSYVVITAARNEEAYIEETIKSVISQTVLPRKWVIVSDGSTDRTDEIVSRYTAKYGFVHLVRVKADNNRNFGSKVNAIGAGYEKLADMDYCFLGVLDADVSLERTYYEQVIAKFHDDPRLGIAGGRLFEDYEGKYILQHSSPLWSVSGPIQMFRRECYEDIGGYSPAKGGGIDAIAEVMARMHGWKVKAFPEIKVLHHRRTGTENRSIWNARFYQGIQDYLLGYHPLFFSLRCLYRIIGRPYLVGSLLMMCGYYWCAFRRPERQVSPEFVKYFRKEQIDRLRSTLNSLVRMLGTYVNLSV